MAAPELIAGLTGGLCGAVWAVRGRSSTVFAPSVWRGPADRKAIALTFDDGPSESTPAILEVLAEHSIAATFFQCGANVDRLSAIAREVKRRGHEIGNHSYAHPLMALKSPAFIEADMRRAQESIAKATGAIPKWFRAPFGVRWFGMQQAQKRLGLNGVMWTVIGYDWSRRSDAVVERVSRRVTNGGILCLHDGRELTVNPDVTSTVESLRRLVPMLLDRGYKFETISRLLCPKN